MGPLHLGQGSFFLLTDWEHKLISKEFFFDHPFVDFLIKVFFTSLSKNLLTWPIFPLLCLY